MGSLVGRNDGSVSNSHWNVEVSAPPGIATGPSSGATGLTSAQMKQQANFVGWDFADTWLSQAGLVDPLLRSFMAPLTVTALDATMTYNGGAYVGSNSVGYSSPPNAGLLGTVTVDSISQNPVNAGSYTLTPSGLYSAQQGYIISYASGTLTIHRAIVNLSGERVHDGTTSFGASLFGTQGAISTGIGTESLMLSGAGTVPSASAGAGVQALNLGTLALADGSGLASNYTLTGGTHTGQITAPNGEGMQASSNNRLDMAIVSSTHIARVQNAVTTDALPSAYEEPDSENTVSNVAPSAWGNTAELNLTVVGTGIKSPGDVPSSNAGGAAEP